MERAIKMWTNKKQKRKEAFTLEKKAVFEMRIEPWFLVQRATLAVDRRSMDDMMDFDCVVYLLYNTLSIAEEIRCIDKEGQSWRCDFLVVVIVIVVIISSILFHQKQMPTKERYCRIVFDVFPSSSYDTWKRSKQYVTRDDIAVDRRLLINHFYVKLFWL